MRIFSLHRLSMQPLGIRWAQISDRQANERRSKLGTVREQDRVGICVSRAGPSGEIVTIWSAAPTNAASSSTLI